MFRQDEEDFTLVEDFKIFPGWEDGGGFKGYLELVKEEANYWKGYTHYLETEIRKLGYYDDLEEGMGLIKKATNLRQSIYSDAALWDKADPRSKRQDDLEKRIVLKAFEVVKLREEFRSYLYMAGIQERLPNNRKMKEPKKEEKNED